MTTSAELSEVSAAIRAHGNAVRRHLSLVRKGLPVAQGERTMAGMGEEAAPRLIHLRPGADKERLLDEWDMWMLAGNLSPVTRSERARIVRQISRLTAQDPTAFTRDGLLRALTAGDRSDSCRLTYFRALQAWSRWLVEAGHRTDDPTEKMPRPREPRRQPRPARTEDVVRLLSCGIYRKTQIMVLLAAYAGLRAGEIARIKGGDVDLGARVLRVRGKGGHDRTVPLHPLLAEIAETMPPRGYWFPAQGDDGHMDVKSVSAVVSRAMARAGIAGTCHSLRHWFGTAGLEAGGTIRQVQELLGHGSVATTELYTHVRASDLIKVVDALPVLPVRVVRGRLRPDDAL